MRADASARDWTVVITQSGARGEELAERLRSRSLAAVHRPLIETVAFSFAEIEHQMSSLPCNLDGWIFTSATAARVFVDFYTSQANWQWGVPVCYCIGETTAKVCSQAGFTVKWSPDIRAAEDLATHIRDQVASGTFVFVRGVQARTVVYEALSEYGFFVWQLTVYRTCMVEAISGELEDLCAPVLWVLFSPSGVEAMIHQLPAICELTNGNGHFLMPFGRTTKQAMDAHHLPTIAMPTSITHDALVDAIDDVIVSHTFGG